MPEIVLDTTISQLEMALTGKIDFVKKTNIFGDGEETEEEKLAKSKPAPEVAAMQIIDFVQRAQANQARQGKK